MEIVVSGTGMLCSLGMNTTQCFSAFCDGISRAEIAKDIEHNFYNQKHVHEVCEPGVGEHEKLSGWLARVINEAITQAKLSFGNKRVAAIVGTGMRELKRLELWWLKNDSIHISNMHFGKAVSTVVGRHIPVYTLSNACSASNFALGLAQDMLELGQADIVIVAGCDTISESMFAAANRMVTTPFSELRSFEQERQGVLLGEGAAALVLEANSRGIKERGAKALAKLLAVGMSCDAYHDTAPLGDGIVESIQDCHIRAGISKEMVDLLIAHGTGTALNDPTEANAIRQVFGPHVSQMRCTAIKGMTGHTSGASALMSVITAIEAINTCRVPPVVGLQTPIREVEGFNLLNESALVDVNIAQVNAFGFGGVNAVALLGACNG